MKDSSYTGVTLSPHKPRYKTKLGRFESVIGMLALLWENLGHRRRENRIRRAHERSGTIIDL
jgi:hypothetical protein